MACLHWKIFHFRCLFGITFAFDSKSLNVFQVIYTYTAELFPTDVRTVGLGLGSLGGGVGGIVAPYILTLQVKLS